MLKSNINLNKLITEKTAELNKLVQQNNELVRQIQQLQIRLKEIQQKCLVLDGAISQLKELQNPTQEENPKTK